MQIFQLLKKHYLATILLIISIGVLIYTGADIHTENQTETSPPPNIDSAITLEPANQIALAEHTKSNKLPKKTETKKILETSTTLANTPDITNTEPVQTTSTTYSNFNRATLVVNGKNYPITLIGTTSLYDVMKNMDEMGTLQVDFKNYSGLGHFVDGINGINSDTFRAKYWIYYINDAKAQIGISNYTLKQNDIITWKYESSE